MKVRAYGADATLKVCRETSYGVAPSSGYRSLDFKSTDLSSEQPLGDDPLLGRGRNAQDPYRGLITDEGKVEIPLDLRGSGFWLTGLFGDPATVQTKAAGRIAFIGQPLANSTITLNGVTWTFVTGTPASNQTQVGVSLDATLTALASDLNASVDAQISKCTYTANTTDDHLEIEFDTTGVTGNAFTLAASVNSGGTVRTITKPVAGTVKVYLNGTLQPSGWSIDTSTGLVTFVSAPAAGAVITADFEFDVPVRFDTDRLEFRLETHDLMVWEQIPITEVRL